MSEDLPPGYTYRVAKASAEQLQKIITDQVVTGSTFGGAAQWDFDTTKKELRDNLRPVKPFTSPIALDDLKGDFGHAFNNDIEVRWRRRDDDDYDVLILSEKEQSISGATPLQIAEGAQWHTRSYAEAAIIQTDDQPAIRYIDYLAPNGAVQFQRFVEVK